MRERERERERERRRMERDRELKALFAPTLFIMVKFLPARMMRWTRETRKKSSAIIRRRS